MLSHHILDQRHGAENEPSAYLTRLGWVAFGPTGSKRQSFMASVNHISCVCDLRETLQANFLEAELLYKPLSVSRSVGRGAISFSGHF